MVIRRVIPTLLMSGVKLVKTTRFKNPVYIGDPINTVKIFNDKEVDELLVFDIAASNNGVIQYDLLQRMAQEAFMPLAYGGGVSDINQVEKIFNLGFEKVCLNNILLTGFDLLKEAVKRFGSQSIIACVDVNKTLFGKYVIYDYKKRKNTAQDLYEHIQKLENAGVGELIVQAVNNDGTMKGYDLELIRSVVERVSVPVVGGGGASNKQDLANCLKTGAQAAAAGALFVFHGPHRAVLINYPKPEEIDKLFRN